MKSKIEKNANLTQGQTVIGNITKRSSKIIKHIDDNKVKAVFSDIPALNEGIMKKVNQQEREDLIRKISKMTVGMDPLTVKKIFEEVEEKNNNEIDPVELAKIKKLIANMFDYTGNPLSQNQSVPQTAKTVAAEAVQTASNMVNQAKSKATNMAKTAFAKKLGLQNTSNMQNQMLAKLATTSLKGGKAKTHKNKHRKSHKNKHKKTQKK